MNTKLLFLLMTLACFVTAEADLVQYNTSQIFLVNVVGSCFGDNVTDSIQSYVNATVFHIFRQYFGPYSLFLPSNFTDTETRRSRQLTVNYCPDCNLRRNHDVCVARGCCSKDTAGNAVGGNDDTVESVAIQTSSNKKKKDCFLFDIHATVTAMNNALLKIETQCHIQLKASITLLEDYNLSGSTESPSFVPTISNQPTQCPIVNTCPFDLTIPSSAPTTSMSPTTEPAIFACSSVNEPENPTRHPSRSPVALNHKNIKECLKLLIENCLHAKHPFQCKRDYISTCEFSSGKAGKLEKKEVCDKFKSKCKKNCEDKK